ncbi:MAG TPA: protein translocase subunit SecF [Vicinamibacterales bacterium]|nr:protein translocase subunit SecF [Vicinamibacterales bacterium]
MHIFTNPNYNFIKWRWHAIILSVAIIGSGIFTIVSRGGLPLGVDFSGGTVLWLKFAKPTAEDTVRNALGPLSGEATVQTFGQPADNEIMVRLPLREGLEQGASLEADAKQVESSLRAANIGDFEVRNRDIVGPTIGEDLKRKGVAATLTALGGILVYIALRFRLSFGIGAIVATFHDILVTLVFLTWFGYELSLNVIAAILTITGYSVNDTIVVFDRVRENQRLARKEPLDRAVNKAVNQTLSRTIITAGTTFLAVLALYLFGGQVLRPMAFTLLVGIITGTYSTVFIAAAVAIILSRRAGSPPVTQAQAKAKVRRA